MDFQKTVENALDDGIEYGVTGGPLSSKDSRAVYVSPPEEYQNTESISQKIVQLFKGEPEDFIVTIYEGDEAVEASTFSRGEVEEARQWAEENY